MLLFTGGVGKGDASASDITDTALGMENSFTFGAPIKAAGALINGFARFASGTQQARSILEEGAVLVWEQYREASMIREEGRRFSATQSLQFISSGVELTGSALITLAQTRKTAITEARALETRGRAIKAKYENKAQIVSDDAKAALVEGVFNATAAVVTGGI